MSAGATQNSGGTAPGRLPGRPFPKGVSGNPGGRPKGLVRAIREQTDDGEQLVAFMLRVFRGEAEGVKLRDRIEAATWLADRGFGKPIQALEHSGRDGEPLIPVDLIQMVVADADDEHEGAGLTPTCGRSSATRTLRQRAPPLRSVAGAGGDTPGARRASPGPP